MERLVRANYAKHHNDPVVVEIDPVLLTVLVRFLSFQKRFEEGFETENNNRSVRRKQHHIDPFHSQDVKVNTPN